MVQRQLKQFERFAERGVKGANWLLLRDGTARSRRVIAAELGKSMGRTVYRLDIVQLFSKYIGETEKSLIMLFQRDERLNWILFFDEADALFGKRTAVSYAHQEVSYLSKRMAAYSGISILATRSSAGLKKTIVKKCISEIRL